jgi:hypothetical protein
MTTALTIASSLIRQDAAGRYCLNDLHKAAGGNPNDLPAFFMRRKETHGLVEELQHQIADSQGGLMLVPPFNVQNGGKTPGTYVVKELVYAYAMWISPKFHIQVIRAYDSLMTGRAARKEPEVLKSVAVEGHGTLNNILEPRAVELAQLPGTPPFFNLTRPDARVHMPMSTTQYAAPWPSGAPSPASKHSSTTRRSSPLPTPADGSGTAPRERESMQWPPVSFVAPYSSTCIT